MSSAHRPTWDPAQGKDSRSNSRIVFSRDIAAHTKLKFRQPGQGTTSEVQRRDLKLELIQAEREATARKARGQSGIAPVAGLIAAPSSAQTQDNDIDESASKRRKILEDVAKLDADDSDDDDNSEDDEDESAAGKRDVKGKGKALGDEEPSNKAKGSDGEDDEDDDSDDDSDDDEDETAELLRELEKIKRERAEERERIEREKAASEQTSREEEIAVGNPLMNLQAALGHSPAPSTLSSSTGTGSSSFGVKRRWDDDVIFKNQARGTTETPKKEFVNDLLRTEFHKRFMKRFVA
ncbi:Cwf15/Cwc15 cell cycle control protein [Meredithblackwellia eburnea MCA 4105]